MVLLLFPGLNGKDGEAWTMNAKGVMVFQGKIGERIDPKGFRDGGGQVVTVSQFGQAARDEMLAFSRSVVAATAKAAG